MAERRVGAASGAGRANDRALGPERRVTRRLVETTSTSKQTSARSQLASELERAADREVALVEQLGRRASEGQRAAGEQKSASIKSAHWEADSERPATTISTIGAQSSQSRIVVALLRDGPQLELKIQEMRPGLFDVGANLAECRKYRDEHERLLRALQRRKEAPIESWTAKFKRVEAERANMSDELRLLYLCMAENLQECWRALLKQLELRLQLLDEACKFFASLDQLVEALERTDQHVQACRQEFLTGAGSARFAQASSRLHKMNQQILSDFLEAKRRQVRLVELIGGLASSNLGDARQSLLVGEAQALINFVRAALDPLERRKMRLETVIASTSSALDTRTLRESESTRNGETGAASGSANSKGRRRTGGAAHAQPPAQQADQTGERQAQSTNVIRQIGGFNDLNLAENWLSVKIGQLNSSALSSLGVGAPDTRSILNKHEQIALECSAIEGALLKFRGKNIHAIRSAESEQQAAVSREPETQQLFEQQRQLATRARHVITILEARIVLLRRTIDFYARARGATKDIGAMMRRLQVDNSLQSVQLVADELELKDVSSVVASGATIISELQQLQLAQQHGQRSSIVSLQLVTGGIRTVIDQLNQELAHLKTLLNQRRLVLLNEDSGKMAQNFSNKCHQLKFWLDNHAKSLLLANSRLACELGALEAWRASHEELRRSMRDKTLEVEALLRLLNTLAENFDAKGQTAEQIQRDTDELRQDWISVTNCLERRLEFARKYSAILQQLGQLGAEIDKLSGWNERPADSADERSLEEIEAQIEQSIGRLGDQVDQFTQEAARLQTGLAHSQPLEHKTALNDINKQQIVGHANGALKLLAERNKSTVAKLNARGPRSWSDSSGVRKSAKTSGRAQTSSSTTVEQTTTTTHASSTTTSARQQQPAQTQPEAQPNEPNRKPEADGRKRRPSRQMAPVFSRPLRDLEVEPFSSVLLECELDPASTVNLAGNYTQQIKVEWLLNNKRIPANIKHSSSSEACRHRLSISQFGPTCCGLYTAHATNQLNGESASTSCRLRLRGIREVEDAPEAPPANKVPPPGPSPIGSTTSSFSTWRPGGSATANNKSQQQPANKERALERIIQGVGSPAASQDESHKEAGLVESTSKLTTTHTTIEQLDKQTLARLPVAQATYAAPRAPAQQQPSRQQLNFIDSPGASSAASRSMSRSPLDGTPQPPVFASGLSDALAHVANRAGLVCVVMGNPPPQVEWLHDGRPIASAKCARIAAQPRASLCKLTIETVDDHTQGQYVCRATNKLGQSTSTPLTLAK